MDAEMSGTPSPSPRVLPYATPAAKPVTSRGVTGFASDFLRGTALACASLVLLLCARGLWDYRAGQIHANEFKQDLFWVLIGLALMSGLGALAAAAGAGLKRCALQSHVTFPRWVGLAGGMFSMLANIGSLWAFQRHERTAWLLAAAIPAIAGFLLVRRAPDGDPVDSVST